MNRALQQGQGRCHLEAAASHPTTLQAALYERLQDLALQAFYRTTMQARGRPVCHMGRLCEALGQQALGRLCDYTPAHIAYLLRFHPRSHSTHHPIEQGRNLAILEGIKERRAAEAAEARAREEAQLRRAEGLRAWMAAVCQRHREEREQAAAAAVAAAAAAAAGADSGSLEPGCSSAGRGSDAGSDGATAAAVAVLQQHFAAARQALATPQAPAAAVASAGQQHSPGWRAGRAEAGVRQPSRHAGRKQEPAGGCGLSIVGKAPAAAASSVDSARTSAAGGLPAGEASAGSRRRPRSAGCPPSRPRTVTVEEVIEQRQAAAAAAAASAGSQQQQAGAWPATRPPTAPGSAALAAWEALTARSGRQSSGAEAAGLGSPGRSQAQAQAPPACAPWQEAAWESYGRPPGACPPSGRSRFLERVATFTAAQQGAQEQAAAAAERARGELPELLDLRLSSSGSSLADSAASRGASGSGGADGCGARGVPTPLLDSLASAGLDGTSAAATTYIPPALLSALHTVRMTPGLLGGLRPAPPADGAVQKQAQRRKGSRPDAAPGSPPPKGGCSPGREARASRVLLDAPLTAAGGRSPSKQPCGAGGSPAAKALAGGACSPAARSPVAPALGGPASGGGSPACARRQYKQAVEQQAVQSVAALISDLILERRL